MAKKKKVAKKITRAAAKKPAKAAPRKTMKHAAKPARTSIAKTFVAAEMKFAHEVLTKLIADFPEDKYFFQPSGTDTHLAWHLGHLAMTYAWFHTAIDGQKATFPESYSALFGMGSTAKPDPSAYPPIGELRDAFHNTWTAFVRTFEFESEEKLTGAPAIDTGGFAKSKMEIGMHASWHDGWHSGQLSAVRRALALKPIWG